LVKSCVTKHKTHVTVISRLPHWLFVLRLCRGYRDFHGQSISRAMRFVGSADSDRVDSPLFLFLGTENGAGSFRKEGA
jgi:hypothetical protein